MSKLETGRETKASKTFSLPLSILQYIGQNEKRYNGGSQLAAVAFSEFRVNEERREIQDTLFEFLKENPENEEVKKILKSMPIDKVNLVRAYIIKGMASIVLGQAEEALEYFNEAKKLEDSEQKKNTDEEMTVSEQLETDTVPNKTTRRVILK